MAEYLDWPTARAILSKVPRRHLAAAYAIIITIITFTTLHPSISLSPSLPSVSVPSLPTIPSISLDYPKPSPFNSSKVALLIENRPIPHLAPLIIHMINVVPPDWKHRFMGSEESVRFIISSKAIQHQVERGKLDLTLIPSNMSTSGQEEISQFLTKLWVYETLLAGTEWLLLYQTDSIICAASPLPLSHFLTFNYDWLGAPWYPWSRYGGNGGLSLRRVSSIIQVLRHQTRKPYTDPEDVWLTSRLGHRPGAVVANGSVSVEFSGENYLPEGGRPLGFHTGSSGQNLGAGVWGRKENRERIWDYCPEIKMELEMDLAKYIPGECNAEW